MWWNDIAEIKDWMSSVCHRLTTIEMENKADKYLFDRIIESIHNVFCNEDEQNPINRIHDKLDSLLRDAVKVQDFLLAEKTMDKFEDYMKNIEKVNSMINEFKGCVSMARGAIAEGKELYKEVDGMKGLAAIAQDIYRSMHTFITAAETMENRAHFKIDAIYKAVCEKQEKKSPKKGKKSCSIQKK